MFGIEKLILKISYAAKRYQISVCHNCLEIVKQLLYILYLSWKGNEEVTSSMNLFLVKK